MRHRAVATASPTRAAAVPLQAAPAPAHARRVAPAGAADGTGGDVAVLDEPEAPAAPPAPAAVTPVRDALSGSDPRDGSATGDASAESLAPGSVSVETAPPVPGGLGDPGGPIPPASPAATVRPLEIEVPARIDRYVIGARIGSGTCGIVHQARDERLDRDVAVKLSPVGEAQLTDGKVPGAQRAYQTEIIAAGRLAHPNIVTVHDAGTEGPLNYLVMEVIEGRSLKEYGKGKAPLPVHRALSAIVDCCRALDYSHARGILHRDIKPANVMLSSSGSAKLLDFGIAVGLDADAGLARKAPVLGTPNYMSPEQILGRELTPASDLYSLSAVMFELLCGRQLFKAKKVKELFRIVVNHPAPRLDSVKPELPAALADILERALAKDPTERFQSGSELAAALAPLVERFRIVEQRPPAQRRFIRELQRQSFFEGFADVEIARLLELVRVRSFRPGEPLLVPTDAGRRLMILTDGIARVTEAGDLIGVIGQGESIGELGFINGMPDPRSIVALTHVNVLEISSESLSELPPKVHLHYYRAISDRLVKRHASDGRLALDHVL